MPRFTLKILTDFAASHQLRDYPGECARLHGHNWKVEVEVSAGQLDQQGMVMDFKDIKRATHEVIARLDHRHLNDCPPFDKINPTVENIAAHLFAEIGKIVSSETAHLSAITIWETDRACVRYTE
ncbi:MAG: 6-carboxytetrahydropterin synthase QueD [Gammaproteobacteria bacterium]|nr:MAG: 6-carboxytetrahydropterin synthase QueD [Gammaproteobacteria bacterium]